jgi:prepilin-type N-terminal cleavage/methylation domain-containing protein
MQPRRPTGPRSAGFTLIELLVVISIIVIMMGVVLGVSATVVGGYAAVIGREQVSAVFAATRSEAMQSGEPRGLLFAHEAGEPVVATIIYDTGRVSGGERVFAIDPDRSSQTLPDRTVVRSPNSTTGGGTVLFAVLFNRTGALEQSAVGTEIALDYDLSNTAVDQTDVPVSLYAAFAGSQEARQEGGTHGTAAERTWVLANGEWVLLNRYTGRALQDPS